MGHVSRPPALHAIAEVVLDCSDPRMLAGFYADLLQVDLRTSRPEWCALHTTPVVLAFQRVPEAKAGKNRCHVDFDCDDLAAAVRRAEDLGARALTEVIEEEGGTFVVLADPEGNEFCFVHGYDLTDGQHSGPRA